MRRRTVWKRFRALYRRIPRFVVYRVLHVDDTPHRIALGVAVGVFVTLTPTIGLQMVLVVALATLLQANKLVGIPFVWASNPLTLVPIYYPSYRLGAALLPGWEGKPLRWWEQQVRVLFSRNTGWFERFLAPWDFAKEVAVPLWVGSILMGLAAGALAYWLTYVGVVRYRRGRDIRLAKKTQSEHGSSGDLPLQ